MALTASWPGVNALATTTDARKNLAGLIETSAAGVVRSGVFPSNLNAIITARGDMNVDIAIFQGVTVQFGGPVLIANDAVAQLPSVLVSPGSGTNYYVVYAKQNESTAPGTDASTTRVFGAALSTSSVAAARALMPAGALELGTVQIPTGKTATSNSGVAIIQTCQFTAAEGGVVWVRNFTELNAWAPADGGLTYRVDNNTMYQRSNGTWVPISPFSFRAARATTGAYASGAIVGLLAVDPGISLPAGDYRITFVMTIGETAATGGEIRVAVNGTVVFGPIAADHIGASRQQFIFDDIYTLASEGPLAVEFRDFRATGTPTVYVGSVGMIQRV